MSNPFVAYGPRRVLLAATVALLSAAPLACGQPLTVADQYKTLGVTEVELFSGLVQRITVTPAAPAIGQEVEIRSVVRNAGDATPRFLSNVCRLDLESALQLTTARDWAECKALPRQIDLAAGDSVVVSTRQLVSGVEGEYEIRVLHALEPLRWVPVRIRLLPRR